MTLCTILAVVGLTALCPVPDPQPDPTVAALTALTAEVGGLRRDAQAERDEDLRREASAKAKRAWLYGGLGDNPRVEEPRLGND